MKTSLFLIVCLTLSLNIIAQQGLSIHFGPSFPGKDFGSMDLDSDNAGGASTGFIIGGKYFIRSSVDNVSLFLGIDYAYNGLKRSVKDDLKELFGSETSIKYYKHINIPIMAGVNLKFNTGEKIAVICNAGIGVDFLKITNLHVEGNRGEITFKFKSDPEIACQLGAGVLIGRRTSVELIYNALGKHTVGLEANRYPYESADTKMKINLITFTVGYIIW
jgi:hypothetical protein